ncbi:MAG: exodeoxyribonuclease VII large subunit [Bdellovibrionales bacterium]|nr:exodeoxyribonuclease VII large subunit [Bdellovibrionales bacterium]
MVTPRAKSSTAVVQEDLFAIPAAAKAEPAEKPAPKPKVPEGPRVYSVTEITQNLRDSLRERFPEILVQGEICDYKGAHRSGHLYFGLKDEKAQLRAVMWKPDASRIPFEVKNGQEVILTGRLDFYPAGGSLQLVATRMEPVGIGALQLKFEQLKEKLKAEGLFDAARKRRVAPLNWRIGVVTGRSTAALQDMLKIFAMRFPLAEIFFFHAAVQGEKAAPEIVAAIQRANRYSAGAAKPLDVLIVGRGGGSYEDLFVFNDESVARALAASKIPTVSAVGHEIDFTIADMVADRRSATPSHAAQETVPELALWLVRLEEIETMFQRRAGDAIQDLRQRVDLLHARILGAAPQKRLELQKQTLKERRVRLERLMSLALERRQQTVARYAGLLDALSPLRVIERGYSLTEGPRGLVRSSRDAAPGDTLKLRFSDGFLKAQVLERTELG